MTRTLHRDAPAALIGRKPVARLLDALAAPGEETRIVGGAVRDALLGREAGEIDLATTLHPKATMRRAREAGLRPVPTGLDHGTVTVVAEGQPFEVTTLREDVETDGRHAVVRFGRDFAADATRRDFTINALSLGPDGRLHDYTGGLDDLTAARVRFIGDPATRIREDYLRILRFFRFTAEYAEGVPDPGGLDAAIRGRDGLDRLSRERVRAEFLRLLTARRAVETVATLQDAGLLGRLTGGVGELGRLARAAGAGLDAAGHLAALAVTTAEDADRLRERLRLSNAEHERLSTYASVLVRLRSRTALDRAEARRLAAIFGLGPLRDALAIVEGEPRPSLTADGSRQMAAFAGGEAVPVLPLSGADLVRSGVPAGPEVGRRLVRVREAWLAAGCPEDWAIEDMR